MKKWVDVISDDFISKPFCMKDPLCTVREGIENIARYVNS